MEATGYRLTYVARRLAEQIWVCLIDYVVQMSGLEIYFVSFVVTSEHLGMGTFVTHKHTHTSPRPHGRLTTCTWSLN